MKPKTGYKVCHMWKGQTWSSGVARMRGALRYRLNEWRLPESGNGPLAVFAKLADAMAFQQFTRFKIYKCKYIPSWKTEQWYVNSNNDMHVLASWKMPRGKVLADKVMLLRRVK